MKIRSFSLLGLASALILIAAPALATPFHAFQNHQQKNHKVLLNEHSIFARLNLDALRVNLRGDKDKDKPGHGKEHKHLHLGPRHAHTKPSGTPNTPPSHDVPMPEPGAALLFALGTGMVATYLRRPRTA